MRKIVKNRSTSIKPGHLALVSTTERILEDLRPLIEEARRRAVIATNMALVMRNWQIGRRIRADILNFERAGYGKKIVATLSQQLTLEFGRGFTRDVLFQMIHFAEHFQNPKIGALFTPRAFARKVPISCEYWNCIFSKLSVEFVAKNHTNAPLFILPN